ncbi:adenylyl cyclase-associated protein 1-like [Sarcoptes scabiei]|nr:adenylyl cyclase-associated protein 1-like [Sarcoptes scabiei]
MMLLSVKKMLNSIMNGIRSDSSRSFDLFRMIRTKLNLLIMLVVIILVIWFVFGTIITIVLGLIAILYYIYSLCDKILFNPYNPIDSRLNISTPDQYGLIYENHYIYTDDSVKIHLFFIKQPKPDQCPTLIYLHGNAGNVGHRLMNAYQLYQSLHCNILLLEYRGYGLSEGKPSESGLCLDALAAINFAEKSQIIDKSKVILFGRSLGGAVAISIAHRILKKLDDHNMLRPCALIIENTFTSVPDISRHLFIDIYYNDPNRSKWIAFLGFALRLIPDFCYKSRFNSIGKIGHINTPTLFLSGLQDELIPSRMMVKLFRFLFRIAFSSIIQRISYIR